MYVCMSAYVCMYVCMSAYMCICVYLGQWVRVWGVRSKNEDEHTHTHTHAHTRAHTRAHTHQSKVSALEKRLVQLNQAKAAMEVQIQELQQSSPLAPRIRGSAPGQVLFPPAHSRLPTPFHFSPLLPLEISQRHAAGGGGGGGGGGVGMLW